ncbi:mitochondrial carrier [Dentipellis sp. KUC8613]|nr:mitochondrial carrier [Dentipellis sp. KUC8613]
MSAQSPHKSYPFWLGGVAASSACCTHPLDLTKVRMQTWTGEAHPTTFTVLRASIKSSGFRSLYTGVSASIMRQMSYSLVRLGAYEEMKRYLLHGGQASTGALLLAAMAAGGIGGVAGNPADVLLVRMTSDMTRQPKDRYNYSNAISGLISLVKSEGFHGLTRGIGTNTLRAVLMNGSQVGSYDFFKTYLLRHPIPLTNYQLEDNIGLHTVASCLAGTVATTVCAPADVMKSRLMSQHGHAKPLDILKRSLKEEGPRFLFKGWTPAFVRLGPNTVLLFVFFEQLKKGWDTLR